VFEKWRVYSIGNNNSAKTLLPFIDGRFGVCLVEERCFTIPKVYTFCYSYTEFILLLWENSFCKECYLYAKELMFIVGNYAWGILSKSNSTSYIKIMVLTNKQFPLSTDCKRFKKTFFPEVYTSYNTIEEI